MICDISSRRALFPATASVVIGWVDMGGHHDVRGRGKQHTTAGYVQVRTLTDHDLIDYRQVEITLLIDLLD